MKKEAVEVLFTSIKNDEKMIERLALLIERTGSTLLEDVCAPVATNVLVDVEGILSVLKNKFPGFTFEYKGPVFNNNDVEGLKFACTTPERFVKKTDRWVDTFKDPYSLTQNEEFTEKRPRDWTERTFPLDTFPSGYYEVKYL